MMPCDQLDAIFNLNSEYWPNRIEETRVIADLVGQNEERRALAFDKIKIYNDMIKISERMRNIKLKLLSFDGRQMNGLHVEGND